MPAGFYDAVVAAPSQAAALRAWGTTTDLFAAGRASIVEDEALKAEALARPGEVIKKSRGDEAAMLGPESAPRSAGRRTRPQRKPAPSRPDRSTLAAAERALTEANAGITTELDEIARQRAELDRQEAEIRARGKSRLAELRRAKEAAERAFDQAVAEYEAAARR